MYTIIPSFAIEYSIFESIDSKIHCSVDICSQNSTDLRNNSKIEDKIQVEFVDDERTKKNYNCTKFFRL